MSEMLGLTNQRGIKLRSFKGKHSPEQIHPLHLPREKKIGGEKNAVIHCGSLSSRNQRKVDLKKKKKSWGNFFLN